MCGIIILTIERVICMKFVIVGRNIEVTPGLRTAVEDKIGKLEKYFNPDTEAHVTLSVEKERQKIEVTIPVKGSIIRSEQVSNDMYVSIDLVEEIAPLFFHYRLPPGSAADPSYKTPPAAVRGSFWKILFPIPVCVNPLDSVSYSDSILSTIQKLFS